MPETILTDTKYRKLLKDLRDILEEGRSRAEQATSQILVDTYWNVGKRITEEGLTETAGYGDSIYEDLAEDLGLDYDTLRRAVLFFEQNEKVAPRGENLTWSHHRELLLVTDEKERSYYQEKGEKEAWTRDELVRAIRRDEFGSKEGTKKSKSKLTRPTEPTYVYKAKVQKTVDGDTLLLLIDLGFQVWKEQRVRLAGIDCPPIDEKKGYEAFEFVRDRLASVPFVVVRTNKIDIYGRYVADLFYSDKLKSSEKIFLEGKYLNQELLDEGLARLV